MTRSLENSWDSWPDNSKSDDDLYDRVDDDTFHIGYGGVAASVLVCKVCGGREFNVGKGSWYTAIKCVKCLWELCVHSG